MSIARDISRQTSRQIATLTANQTSVTVSGGFSGSNIDVYFNGARIIQGSDYTLNGTSGITLTQGASAGDIIEFVIRNTSNSGFNTADTGRIVDGAVTFDKLSNSVTEIQNVQQRTAAAWVNFNGKFTTTPYTESNGGIRSAFGVDSVTDLGSTGYYQINFSRPFANNDWVMCGTARFHQNANNTTAMVQLHRNRTLDSAMTTTSAIITTTYDVGSLYDSEYVGLVFFGELA